MARLCAPLMGLWILGACGPAEPAKPTPAAARPTASPRPFSSERHGLSVPIPGPWTSTPGMGDVLLELRAAPRLAGRLSLVKGGLPLDGVTKTVLDALRKEMKTVDILRRAPWLEQGVRLELRASKGLVALKINVALVFHRGRFIQLLVSSPQGDWHETSSDVETLFAGVRLTPGPSSSSAAASEKHGYSFALPKDWCFEEADPPEAPLLGRFWAPGGLPWGTVLLFPGASEAQPSLDIYLAGIPDKGEAKILHRDGAAATYALTVGTTRLQRRIRAFQRPQGAFLLEVGCAVEDFATLQSAFDSLLDSFK